MDRGDIGTFNRHCLGNQSISQKPGADPFAQLARCGLSEGDSKDAFRPHHAALHPVGKLGLNAVGFARARAGGDDDQSLIHGHSSSI